MKVVTVPLTVERDGAEVALEAEVAFYPADDYNDPSADVRASLGGERWTGRLTDEEEETAVLRAACWY